MVARTPDSEQLAWLRSDLAANPAACTLAFFHHPRFSSDDRAGSYAPAGPFWDALYDAGADVILGAHAHTYERFAPQTPSGDPDPARGIRQFVVGTGGGSLHGLAERLPNSEFFDAGTLGVLRLELREGGYDWQFMRAAGGENADRGSAACR